MIESAILELTFAVSSSRLVSFIGSLRSSCSSRCSGSADECCDGRPSVSCPVLLRYLTLNVIMLEATLSLAAARHPDPESGFEVELTHVMLSVFTVFIEMSYDGGALYEMSLSRTARIHHRAVISYQPLLFWSSSSSTDQTTPFKPSVTAPSPHPAARLAQSSLRTANHANKFSGRSGASLIALRRSRSAIPTIPAFCTAQLA